MSDRERQCPKCKGTKEPSRGDDRRGRDDCGRCHGRGTIPERRKPTAADRAVERIKVMADGVAQGTNPDEFTQGQAVMAEELLRIIREEAERG